LLQETLLEQEASLRKEMEEVQQCAKAAQTNLERQLREFKVQL
jgi:hypothetical protein